MLTLKKVRITRTMMVIAALALTALIVIPAVANEPVDMSISGGDRSVNVTSVVIQGADYSHDDQTVPGSVSLSIDDSTGSDAGWNVTVQSSDFADGDRIIPASQFAIVNAGAPVHQAGQEIDGANGPMTPSNGATGSLDVARKVLNANQGYGKGSYTQDLDVELTVPGQTLAGNYGASLTVNITAGP